MRKKIKLINNGVTSIIYEPEYTGVKLDFINLQDMNGQDIFVGDILYCKNTDTYFTVFEMPGGYCIEGNPKFFGLHEDSDPFPIVESISEPQTSSFIRESCSVVGDIYTSKELYKSIKDEYKNFSKKTSK
jgi:hypothetical protein